MDNVEKNGRISDSPPMEWEKDLGSVYGTVYTSESVPCKSSGIWALKQGPMTVEEYVTQFTRLARFAPHALPNERERIRRFIMGLRPSLRQLVGIQIATCPTYEVMIDVARLMEMVDIEKKDQRKMGKKGQFCRGNFSVSATYS